VLVEIADDAHEVALGFSREVCKQCAPLLRVAWVAVDMADQEPLARDFNAVPRKVERLVAGDLLEGNEIDAVEHVAGQLATVRHMDRITNRPSF
jgi:hypothetical protein